MIHILHDNEFRAAFGLGFLIIAAGIVIITTFNIILLNKQSIVQKNVLSQKLFPALYMMFFGLIFVGYASLSLFRFELGLQYISVWRACIGAALGFVFSAPAMMGLRPEYNVIWDEEKLEGPSKIVGPYAFIFFVLKKERRTILWQDIVAQGQVGTRYLYLSSQNGAKIYFSPDWNNSADFENKYSRCIFQNEDI